MLEWEKIGKLPAGMGEGGRGYLGNCSLRLCCDSAPDYWHVDLVTKARVHLPISSFLIFGLGNSSTVASVVCFDVDASRTPRNFAAVYLNELVEAAETAIMSF